jgi:hypothetical protein
MVFLEGVLKGSSSDLYLAEQSISVHIDELHFEVNINPRLCIPRAWSEIMELGGLSLYPRFMCLDGVELMAFCEVMSSLCLSFFSNSHGINSRVHSEDLDLMIPERPPVLCNSAEITYLDSPPCVDNIEMAMCDSPSVTGSTMGNFISSRYFNAYVVPCTFYSRSPSVCSGANSLRFSPARSGSPGSCSPLAVDTYGYSLHTRCSTYYARRGYFFKFVEAIQEVESALKHNRDWQ